MSADILFVPVSGAQGAGELYRCLALAGACHVQYPQWSLHLAVNRDARLRAPDWLQEHELAASPTRDEAGMQQLLADIAPRIVVFDNTLRRRQVRQAHAHGARTVYISARPNRRRRGFDPRKLALLDEHWMIAPPHQHHLRWWERLLCFAGKPRMRFFSALASPADATRRASLLGAHGFAPNGYVLFVSGGGGGQVNARPTAEIFQQAARSFHQQTGLPTLYVAGPLARAELQSEAGRLELASLSPQALGDVLDGALLVVTGGGSLLNQSLAHERPCLAVATGGRDQPARLRLLSATGVIETCETRPEVMCERAIALAENETRHTRLVDAARQAGYVNGIPDAVHALRALRDE